MSTDMNDKTKSHRPLRGVQTIPPGQASAAARNCIAAALRRGGLQQQAKNLVAQPDQWRSQYYRHFVALAEASAAGGGDIAVEMAQSGLDAIRDHFSFRSCDGNEHPLDQAANMLLNGKQNGDHLLHSIVVKGSNVQEHREPELWYRGKQHHGAAIRSIVADWIERGIVEPTFAAVVEELQQNPHWMDLRDKHFAIIGAGSQMGPAEELLNLGATVYAIDLPKPAVWQRLIDICRKSSGTLVVPVMGDKLARLPELQSRESTTSSSDAVLSTIAGCDLLEQVPEVTEWLVNRVAPAKQLVLGSYVYLDGALFTRVAVATDAITATVLQRRGPWGRSPGGVALAHLCSPTEVHFVPAAARDTAVQRYSEIGVHSLWEKPIEVLSGGRYLERNEATTVECTSGTNSGRHFYVQDSIVWSQGPNYSFAKQLQKWRLLVAHRAGHVCSATVAPATLTESVMHNRLIAAGMLGCAVFGIEAFEVPSSKAIQTMALLWDLHSSSSLANPANHQSEINWPYDIFIQNACHGMYFDEAPMMQCVKSEYQCNVTIFLPDHSDCHTVAMAIQRTYVQ
eukprot:m.67962 g.67962  ORF g.67962 m.67962 type:complete len:567 (-) comp15974_c0_seq1:1323-3023(-)